MDAFYASVEQRDDPGLRGRPVVIAGPPDSRAVVCSASYEARARGVRSAIPSSHAYRLCPEAVFVKPNFEKYRAVSRHIREIFLRHTPLVEPLSLDEAYLDVTAELTGLPTATEAAEAIRRAISEELSLTASAGVAPNKFLAKIASDWRKPNGIFVIKPHHVERFLLPLPVRKLPGVGKTTEAALARDGIAIVGDLRQLDAETLVARYGKFGQRLWELAHGIDESPVVPSRPSKSISSEETFEADLTLPEVAPLLPRMAESIWTSLARQEMQAKTVTVKLRNSAFRTETRRLTTSEPLAGPEAIVETANMLLGRFSFGEGERFRLLGLGLSNFDQRSTDAGESTAAESLF